MNKPIHPGGPDHVEPLPLDAWVIGFWVFAVAMSCIWVVGAVTLVRWFGERL